MDLTHLYLILITLYAVVYTAIDQFIAGKDISAHEIDFISASWSISDAVHAEDLFFNAPDSRVILYYVVSDGVVSYYLDESLEQPALDGFYCDGFYIIHIHDVVTEITEIQ